MFTNEIVLKDELFQASLSLGTHSKLPSLHRLLWADCIHLDLPPERLQDTIFFPEMNAELRNSLVRACQPT